MQTVLLRLAAFCAVRFIASVFALSFLIAPAHAADLSASQVESFIASLHEVQNKVVNSPDNDFPEELMNDDDMNTDFSTMFSASLDDLKDYPATERKVRSIAEAHGFDSLQEWAQTGDRVFTAFFALQSEGQPSMPMMMDPSAMEEYMAALEYLPEAEKQQMRKMMEGFQESNQAVQNVSRADKDAVRPYVNDLMAFHEMESE